MLRIERSKTRILLLLIVSSVISACDARRIVTSDDASYVLMVRVRSPEALPAVGAALSWQLGVVPSARLIAIRKSIDSTEPIVSDTAISDANGVAKLTGLARGMYELRIDREFSAAERERASDALGSVDALVSTGAVTLADSTSVTLVVSLLPTGGGSLTFTEIAPAWPPARNGDQYYYGGYFRITNTSDTIVTLADKIWFDAHGGYIRNPVVPNGCSYFLPLERDPGGVWTRWVYRFPSDAKPLRPGASALLATDALDHRAFSGAGFHDLSRAEFEFLGPADVDNPLAANMIDLSPREYSDGHGWRFRGGRQVWGLASSLKIDTLPRIVRLPFDASQSTWVRIPRAALLDLVRYNWNVPQFDPLTVDCPSPILGDVDAADAVLLTVEDTLTLHRRVARTLTTGRIIFQRSRNSAADWIAGKATPGQIP
jgi:hypothetical protein